MGDGTGEETSSGQRKDKSPAPEGVFIKRYVGSGSRKSEQKTSTTKPDTPAAASASASNESGNTLVNGEAQVNG